MVKSNYDISSRKITQPTTLSRIYAKISKNHLMFFEFLPRLHLITRRVYKNLSSYNFVLYFSSIYANINAFIADLTEQKLIEKHKSVIVGVNEGHHNQN